MLRTLACRVAQGFRMKWSSMKVNSDNGTVTEKKMLMWAFPCLAWPYSSATAYCLRSDLTWRPDKR